MNRRLVLLSGIGLLAAGGALILRLTVLDKHIGKTRPVRRSAQVVPEPGEFVTIRRGGSVDLAASFDLSGLSIPEEEIHTLLPKDRFVALVDPKLAPSAGADWMRADDRVIDVTINSESVAVPLTVLTAHEVANMTVGGEPIAATYCPLCDSASVFSRRVSTGSGDDEAGERVLEFGVTGALFNSNVLMYDRTDNALWSQLGMEAVSGPLVGTVLRHLPVSVVSFGAFVAAHPDGGVLSFDQGNGYSYGRGGYAAYFATDDLLVPVKDVGDAIERRKTLGVGVVDGASSWFVTAESIGDGYTLTVNRGEVRLSSSESGVVVESAPDGVHTAQAYYFAWSAFRPETMVVTKHEPE